MGIIRHVLACAGPVWADFWLILRPEHVRVMPKVVSLLVIKLLMKSLLHFSFVFDFIYKLMTWGSVIWRCWKLPSHYERYPLWRYMKSLVDSCSGFMTSLDSSNYPIWYRDSERDFHYFRLILTGCLGASRWPSSGSFTQQTLKIWYEPQNDWAIVGPFLWL